MLENSEFTRCCPGWYQAAQRGQGYPWDGPVAIPCSSSPICRRNTFATTREAPVARVATTTPGTFRISNRNCVPATFPYGPHGVPDETALATTEPCVP